MGELAWEGGACRVAMWWGTGAPAGLCGKQAFGPQLPLDVLRARRGDYRAPHCHGPCCPTHGGPAEGEPIIFQDGLTDEGRPMWCAVMPGFKNLQESEAAYSGNPLEALAMLAQRTLATKSDERGAE